MIAVAESPVINRPGAPSAVDRVAELQNTISASRLSLWLACRLKFYFRYILQVQKPPTPSMHAGSTVHGVLQQWNMARWRREPFVIGRFKTFFGSHWTTLQQGAQISWDGEEESERASAWRVLEHYLTETPIKADEKPEAVEVRVEADLSTHGLPTLVGILDLVRAGGRIVDFKVVGKSPDAQQLVHVHEVQLTCYSLLYRDATGRNESALELHHLVKTKAPKLIVSSMPPATEPQKTRLFRQIESYQAGLARRDFVPSPGFHCAGCEYFDACRAWSGKEVCR
jgi:CRISPR/Cas system-associated exonuclease Cas4 (RecB family)